MKNAWAKGFTMIEILITLVIMVILLALGVASFINLQAQDRDKERESDIAAIQRGLEEYYKSGDSRVVGAATQGTYPGTLDFLHIMGTNMCNQNGGSTSYYATSQCYVSGGYAADVLPGVSSDILTPPNSTTLLSTNNSCNDTCLNNKVANGEYVYRPYNAIDSASPNGVCNFSCPRYELWYQKETTAGVIKVKSKYER